MAGPPFQFANHYQIVGHFLGASGTEEWRSEFTISASTPPQPTDPIVGAFETYFRNHLRDDCVLSSLVCRQWSYGPQPLLGRGELWVRVSNLHGEKTVIYGGMQAAPALTGKEVVAFIKINPISAKPGKQFLRQLFDLGDIGAVAGSPWEFIPGGRVTSAVYGTAANTLLAPYLGAGKDPGIVVVHFSKKHYDANPISANLPFSTAALSFALVGPTTNKPTRKNKL